MQFIDEFFLQKATHTESRFVHVVIIPMLISIETIAVLFCLTEHYIHSTLKSKLKMFIVSDCLQQNNMLVHGHVNIIHIHLNNTEHYICTTHDGNFKTLKKGMFILSDPIADQSNLFKYQFVM